jgi:type IV pilus assembly protein PilF
MKTIICVITALLLNACSVKHTPENLTAAGYNVQLGLGYLAQDDRLRAKEKLLRAVEQAPNSQETQLALAYYYEIVGDRLAAEQIYQQALDIEPKAGQVNNNYGAFLCTQGEYQQALVHFERAAQDSHYYQTANAYENAALCSAKMAQFAPTAHYADLALQQDPHRVNMLLKLSYLLEQQGHKTLAQHYLNRYQQAKS